MTNQLTKVDVTSNVTSNATQTTSNVDQMWPQMLTRLKFKFASRLDSTPLISGLSPRRFCCCATLFATFETFATFAHLHNVVILKTLKLKSEDFEKYRPIYCVSPEA